MFRKFFTLFFVTSFLIHFSPSQKGECAPFDGFYVGGAIGVATNIAIMQSFSSAIFAISEGSTESLVERTDPKVFELRPWGEIYGGWGFCPCFFPCLYLGGRVGANFSSWDIKQHSRVTAVGPTGSFVANLDTDIKTHLRSAELTLDFKTGFVYCHTLLFAYVGGSLNRAHLSSHTEFDFTTTTSSVTEFRSRNSKKSYGLRIGGGLETMITRCISLNVSYQYTLYHRPNVSGFANIVTSSGVVVNGLEVKHSAKTRRQVTAIGLSYYF